MTALLSGHDEERVGVLAGAAAYGVWGLFPLYFRLLEPTSSVEILCHRIIWSLVVLATVLAVVGDRGWLRELFSDLRRLALLGAAAVLIAVNWIVWVFAVTNDRAVEGALGYFICPLVTVALGVGVLRERLRRPQWFALALGSVAVVVLTVAYGHPPWLALTLAGTFAAYGFIKKHIDLGATRSLAGETALLAPVAVATMAVLIARGEAEFGQGGAAMSVLLAGTGVVTVVPLVLFASAATRIPLSLLGLLQYLTPVTQFVLAVVVFDETMSPQQWFGFALVWAALGFLSVDAVVSLRHPPPGATGGPHSASASTDAPAARSRAHRRYTRDERP